jgi:tetratricopeptide (TPR) repeat protein
MLLNRISRPAALIADADVWDRIEQDVAALRLVCLTATGKFADAAATLEQLRAVSTDELMGVLSKLSGAGKQLTGPPRLELARLELETIKRIRIQGGELSPEQRQQLAECEAEALFASGRYAEAARMFEEAASIRPELTPRLADSLMKAGQPRDLERARTLWQQHEARQKQGTRSWFEARLRLAECFVALGQSAELRKLIVSTRIVYPELGGMDLKARFDELERTARNR